MGIKRRIQDKKIRLKFNSIEFQAWWQSDLPAISFIDEVQD